MCYIVVDYLYSVQTGHRAPPFGLAGNIVGYRSIATGFKLQPG